MLLVLEFLKEIVQSLKFKNQQNKLLYYKILMDMKCLIKSFDLYISFNIKIK